MVAYQDMNEKVKLEYLTKENGQLRKEMKYLNEALNLLVEQIKVEK